MHADHFSRNQRATVTVGTGWLKATYRDEAVRIIAASEPEREIACFDVATFTELPYLLPLMLECFHKDASLKERTRLQAGEMARRIRYATQIRSAPEFTSQEMFKKAAELFGNSPLAEEADITISRNDLKAILACAWGHAMEEFMFTPLENRANHIFPTMAKWFEQLAGRNEELRQFVEDGLSEEVETQISEGVRHIPSA